MKSDGWWSSSHGRAHELVVLDPWEGSADLGDCVCGRDDARLEYGDGSIRPSRREAPRNRQREGLGTQMPKAMDLMGEIVALSIKHGMGIDVGEELKDILRRCDSEEDRRVVIQQYKALGLPYGGA